MLGCAGLSGSRMIYQAEDCRTALLKRYPERFFAGLSERSEEQEREAALGLLEDFGIPEEHYREAAEGGVFAALWNLLRDNRLGASFSQRSIPLRQQTVEICEQYGLNPFRLYGGGCFVCLTAEGARLSAAAEEKGVCCRVIGYTEKGPAIRRRDGEETAYLRRPEPERWPEEMQGDKEERRQSGIPVCREGHGDKEVRR